MSGRGLRYWLQWPHTRRDHAVATAVFLVLTLAMAAADAFVAALFGAVVTLVLATKVVWWETGEDRATGGDRAADGNRATDADEAIREDEVVREDATDDVDERG